MRHLFRTAILAFTFLVIFGLHLPSSSAEFITLQTKKYVLEVEDSTIRLYARWPSGRVYREQYLEVILTHFQELSNWTMSTDPKYTTAIYRVAETWVAKSFVQQLGGLTNDDPPVSVDVVTETFDFVGKDCRASAEVGVYNGSTVIDLGPFNVTTVPDSLKVSILSDKWTFQPNTVAWRFWLNFTMYAPLNTISRYQSLDKARRAIRLDLATEALNITMWFQDDAVLNGNTYPVTTTDFTLSIPESASGIRFTQAWQYPKFTTFKYDPDFSVILRLDDPGMPPGDLPPDGSAALAPDAFPGWIAAVIVVAAILIIAAVCIIFYVRYRNRVERDARVLRGKMAREQVTTAEPLAQPQAQSRPSVDARPKGWAKADPTRASLTNTNNSL